MSRGRIQKGIGGFYFVRSGDELHKCHARGIFRLERIKPKVGDFVEYSPQCGDDTGYITKILPRKNELTRPPVANIDCMVLVLAVKPKPDLLLADKLLLLAEHSGMRAVVCVNKLDLDAGSAKAVRDEYSCAGYETVELSTKTGCGIDELKHMLHGTCACFTGQSGVGKSSLLNALFPELKLTTGEMSSKADRGKQTTRHVELIETDGCEVFDSPGFSILEAPLLEFGPTGICYREFRELAKNCAFSGCVHETEPNCAVIRGVLDGTICEGRYERYLAVLKEYMELKRRRYD